MKITNSVYRRRDTRYLGLCFAVLFVFLSSNVQAMSAVSLSQSPLFLVTSATPLVMLNMSNDHQLYFKAYDDYSNLDSTPEAETTYKNSVDYYGYFDSNRCYSYNASGYFEPEDAAVGKYCDAVTGDWSGNFLNWASMSRIDTIRKMLYGGYRSTDTATDTILERAYVPTDAHSFVKYYSDTSDLSKLTPYSSAISICNTTYASSGNSKDITAPPLMRIAQGNYSLWTAHEVNQCHWSEENNNSNSNVPAITGIAASTTPPSKYSAGSAEYKVRLKVCVSGKEEDNCEEYSSGNKKPTGLLHTYGEQGEIDFGLMTGSYEKNKSGGVLRKNISSFADEVDSTNGTFLYPTDSIVSTLNKLRISRFDTGANSYVSLDSCDFAKYGFDDGECSNWGNPQSEIFYESLRYFAGLSATSAFQAPNDSNYINNITSASWVDPYDKTPPFNNYCAPANIIQFNASTSSFDGDQLSGFADFATASQSLDAFTDDVGVGEGVTDAGTYFIGSIPTDTDKSCTAKDLDALSEGSGTCPEAPWLEGTYAISGLAYFANTESIRDDLKEYNAVTTADIHVKTFGVALSAAQPVIRVPVPGSASGQEVVILPACMEFRDGDAGGKATVNVNNRRHNGNCAIVDFKIVEPHTLVGNTATGKFLVLWESAQQGGDYDQDVGSILEYEITPTQITVTTDVYGASTGGIHGIGYIISGTTQDGLHLHSGVNDFKDYDDPYAGISDCMAASIGPCNTGDAATSVTYSLGTTTATQLETPLYYASKWGGFKEESNAAKRPAGVPGPNGVPDEAYEWDGNGDGIPDTYFYSTNPSELVTSLEEVFDAIADQVGSASATAANSQQLSTGTSVFQATFNSADWSGGFAKYDVNTSTNGLDLDTTWGSGGDAGAALPLNSRTIITYNPDLTGVSDDGLAFTWATLSATQQGYLNIDPDTNTADANGSDRLDYLRGDTTNEIDNGGTFRNRNSLLGDIVNSAPAYVGTPNFGYSDILEGAGVETYSQFKTRVSGGSTPREHMIYVGANDGMLHGFQASDGVEKLAYIPFAVTPNLTQLTSPNYSHQYFVDGSPSIGDAVFSDTYWHTVLAAGLNAGGQGVYALDVTNSTNFTESNASNIVLWEITPATLQSSVAVFSELGYTFAAPSIVKNYNGTWVAIFGNGYAGTNGHAILYVVNVQTGALISAVTVDSSGDNGLSTATPVDVNGDGIVDVIYAGDLKGNMWKFIPNSGGTWQSAFGASPLFAAGSSEPITTRPEVGLHPDGLPGVMVYFGTGKYLETGDKTTTDLQRFYGIWDVWDLGSTSSYTSTYPAPYAYNTPSVTPNITVVGGNLQQQCVTDGSAAQTCVSNNQATTGQVVGNYNTRYVSDNPITAWHWDATKGKMGWYLDLPESRERQVSDSLLLGGRIIFVTITPSEHPCANGGSSWLMELDAADGSGLNIPVFDVNGDQVFDAGDQNLNNQDASGAQDPNNPSIITRPTILIDPAGGGDLAVTSSSSDSTPGSDLTSSVLPSRGRKSWIQLK